MKKNISVIIFNFFKVYESSESLLSEKSDEELRSLLSTFHPIILTIVDCGMKAAASMEERSEKEMCALRSRALRALVVVESAALRSRPAETGEKKQRAQSQLYELGRVNNWDPLLLPGQNVPIAFFPPIYAATHLVTGWIPQFGLVIPGISKSDARLITTSQCPQAQFIRAIIVSCDFHARNGIAEYPAMFNEPPLPHQYSDDQVSRMFSELMNLAEKDGMPLPKAMIFSLFPTLAFFKGQELGEVLHNAGIDNTADPQVGERLKNGSYEPTKQEARDLCGLIKGIQRDPKLTKAIQLREDSVKNNKGRRTKYSDTRHTEWDQYRPFLDNYFNRNSENSVTDGRRACAKHFNVALKTIERRTGGYKKPTGKKHRQAN